LMDRVSARAMLAKMALPPCVEVTGDFFLSDTG